jgi:hypothetical protein
MLFRAEMHKTGKILGLSFLMAVLVNHAALASSCYSMREAEAEQGIRIHSELMVIGLNCQHIYKSRGKNLYRAYREFTSEHADLISYYEQVLLEHYRNSAKGSRSSQKKLDKLRTHYANKIADDAARMQINRFCAKYAPRISRVAEYTRQDIREWASTFYSQNPVTKPICNN